MLRRYEVQGFKHKRMLRRLWKFKDSLTNVVALSRFGDLRLESMGLTGIIDLGSLGSMPALRSLSLMNNTFVGEIPDDAFVGLDKLRKIYLANNEFTGKIPSSLATLPSLLILKLDSNKFHGQIPNFPHKYLKIINLSNNELKGPIPANLSTFDPSSFSGNIGLCGPPLKNECQAEAPIPGASVSGKMRIMKILLIVILIALIIAILVAVLATWRLRSQNEPEHQVSALKLQAQASNKNVHPVYVKTKSLAEHYESNSKQGSEYGYGHSKKGEQGKLTFLKNDNLKFDLQDLLKASAEILGSASFGSSYKAVISDGQAVVVKRKEEKLLLSAFVYNGCLASHLHGNHNYQKPGLDWPTRLKIVKGVAKGLAYLYSTLPSLIVPHGHLKSSNVLLDESFEPLLTDYALSPLINLDHAQQVIMPYKSPEYAQLGRITKKTDVWSFGILILEILTGKFPENYISHRHKSDSDIASWVNVMITEKRTGEVFDVEMGGVGNSKAELIKLLKIGLSCCEENVERRLDIKEALEQIEDLKEGESDGEYSSSLISNERDAYRAV
ncbi:Serine-threonine/tyrosine-protein kinase, catalytic domain [Sesbania bispinosa]|nr:Serine-threonine/tyrosine-protein kinase, catalytic domain [Sesbania bispinosa]